MLAGIFDRICEIHSNTQDFCFTPQILSINDNCLSILISNDLIKISQNRSNCIKCDNCDNFANVIENKVVCQECYTIAEIENDKTLWQYELNLEKIASLLASGSPISDRKLNNYSYLICKHHALKTPTMIYLHSGSNFDKIKKEIGKDKKSKHIVITLSKQKEHGLKTVALIDVLSFNEQNEMFVNFDYLASQLDDFADIDKSKTQNAQENKKEAIKWFKNYIVINTTSKKLNKTTSNSAGGYMVKNFGITENMAKDIWKKYATDEMKKGGRRAND